MNFSWHIFIDLGLISMGLLLATFIRAKVKFFQKYLIPNALTAGFLLLPLYNFVLPHIGIDSMGLGELAYHLLSISFVAMALRQTPPAHEKKGQGFFPTSVAIISQFAVQIIVGLLGTYILIQTIMPDLFEPFGYLLPLGFVQGPGQAFAIGQSWETSGIFGAGSVGLTFAALGFVVSCFGGVFLINYGIRRHWIGKEFREALQNQGIKTGVYPKDGPQKLGSTLTTETEAIDSMTFNTAMVLICYFLAYLFLRFLTYTLSMLGPLGAEFATNLWGISFIFAALSGLLVKQVLKILKVHYVLDNNTLNRISGLSVDVMVTSAIAAISVVVVTQFWLPILLLASVATILLFLTVPWFCSRLFEDHQFHRMMLIFGVSSGTLSTGLALLRVIDPEFETPVARDYTYASGITFLLVIPLILSISFPVRTFVTGNMTYFWVALAISLAYLIFAFVSYLVIAKGRAFAKASDVWLHSE